jgi:hypothetical protein
MPQSEVIENIGITRTYKKTTPCLNLYIAIVMRDDEKDKVDYVRISGTSRKDDCGCAYISTLADLLTFSIKRIRNHNEAKLIVKALRDQKCNRYAPNREKITSCPDAIGRAVQDALGVTEEELRGR